eukprot:g32240.t1
MVLLEVKRSEKKNEFLYETTVKVNNGDLLKELCELHNLRLKVLRLSMACKDSTDLSKVTELDVNAYGQPTRPDESGFRTGVPPPPEARAPC